jgi:hypothetical protein
MTDIRRNSDKYRPVRRAALAAVVASLATSAMTWPALAVDRSGTVVATLTVTFAAAPPAGSRVLCGLALIGSDTHAPSDSKSVNVGVANSKAVCKITLRYNWHLASATSKMTIAYTATGPSQTSSGIQSIITVPANAHTTTVAVAISQ